MNQESPPMTFARARWRVKDLRITTFNIYKIINITLMTSIRVIHPLALTRSCTICRTMTARKGLAHRLRWRGREKENEGGRERGSLKKGGRDERREGGPEGGREGLKCKPISMQKIAAVMVIP